MGISVVSFEGFFGVIFVKIVSVGVDDDGVVNDVFGVNEFDEVVGYGVFGVVLGIGFNVV